MRKVLVSLPETDLRVIDAAARKAGETRSSFVRRAALAEARRVRRPIDDPAARRAFSRLIRRAEHGDPITTAEALEARDRVDCQLITADRRLAERARATGHVRLLGKS